MPKGAVQAEFYPKMAQVQYFWCGLESIRSDVGAAGGQASCCGVNLAVAGFGVGVALAINCTLSCLWGREWAADRAWAWAAVGSRRGRGWWVHSRSPPAL